jgi:rod shape determining protein RodA
MLEKIRHSIDWVLFASTLPIVAAGLVTMDSFTSNNYFFLHQIVWAILAVFVFVAASLVDWRFLRNSWFLVFSFLGLLLVLFALAIVGAKVKGAQSRFQLGFFGLQPVEFVKLLVILMLAKYFSRRHVEIANIRHIFVSGLYAFVPFLLVILQPDLGSAIIIFLIWLGMITVSGVPMKYLFGVFAIVVVSFGILWISFLKPYQKDRIMTFVDPLADVRGAGYNAYQSQIAVGSGQIIGKGVGFGTQSRLSFLPEFQTDFIFAAFAEEWGFLGVAIVFILFGIIIYRILVHAMKGASNFEMLYAVGLTIFFMSHFTINAGMNMGLLPVTGIPLPFMSYGGSHLIAEYLGLGILMGMRSYSRVAHRDDMRNEFLGIV